MAKTSPVTSYVAIDHELMDMMDMTAQFSPPLFHYLWMPLSRHFHKRQGSAGCWSQCFHFRNRLQPCTTPAPQ